MKDIRNLNDHHTISENVLGSRLPNLHTSHGTLEFPVIPKKCIFYIRTKENVTFSPDLHLRILVHYGSTENHCFSKDQLK